MVEKRSQILFLLHGDTVREFWETTLKNNKKSMINEITWMAFYQFKFSNRFQIRIFSIEQNDKFAVLLHLNADSGEEPDDDPGLLS